MQSHLREALTPFDHLRFAVALASVMAMVVLIATLQPAMAQEVSSEGSASVANPSSGDRVVLSGVVVAKKKYSFTLQSGRQRFRVKLAEGAVIALRLNQPYFDWEAGEVIVDPAAKSTVLARTDQAVKRVRFPLPAKQLYLISKFRNLDHAKRIMEAEPKRINFYLISPKDLGSHEPTEDDLYLSGKLKTGRNDEEVQLETDRGTHSIKLGFRTATMNGFSITDLKPNRTRLTLSGFRDPESGDLIANRIAFEPLPVVDSSSSMIP